MDKKLEKSLVVILENEEKLELESFGILSLLFIDNVLFAIQTFGQLTHLFYLVKDISLSEKRNNAVLGVSPMSDCFKKKRA